MKIGYQGIEGSNSEEFSKMFIEKENLKDVELVPLINSENVVMKLNDGTIDYGVMAIKNSVAGVVEETRKALENQNVKLIYEESVPIHHCLFKRKNVKIEEINVIASHIQALKQTEKNRKEKFLNCKELEVQDTALAAKYLANGELDNNIAVICRKNAGEMYGLDLIYENIEDDKDNYTEFGVYEKSV